MSQEVSAATVANLAGDQEDEGDDDILRPAPQDLLLFPPLLEGVDTRAKKALAGHEVQGFAPCRSPSCAACKEKSCENRGPALDPDQYCSLCRDGIKTLCVLRQPCMGWRFEDINRFRSAQAAHVAVRAAGALSPRRPSNRGSTPPILPTVTEEEGAGGWSGWKDMEDLPELKAPSKEHKNRAAADAEEDLLSSLPDLSHKMDEVLGDEESLDGTMGLTGVTPKQSPTELYQISAGEGESRWRMEDKLDLSQMIGGEGDARGERTSFHPEPMHPTVKLPGREVERSPPSMFLGPRMTSTPLGPRSTAMGPPRPLGPRGRGGGLSAGPTPGRSATAGREVRFTLPNNQGYGVAPESQTWGFQTQRATAHSGPQQTPIRSVQNTLTDAASGQPYTPGRQDPQGGIWHTTTATAAAANPRENLDREELIGLQNQAKIVDVLQILTDKLMDGGHLSGSTRQQGQLRLPNLSLPTPRRGPSSRVETKEYFLWKAALKKTVENNSLSEEAVLALYATNPKLTTESWSAVFQSSSSLGMAIKKLDQLHPPIEHVYGQLVRQITEMPTMYQLTTRERIYQLNEVLEHLEQFITFFGNTQDLKRSNVLVVLAKLPESKDNKDNFVRQIYTFDNAHRAGIPYCKSLKDYLVEVRLLNVDLESAMEIVEAEEVGTNRSNIRTAATKVDSRPQNKTKQEVKKTGRQPRATTDRPPRPPPHCIQCSSTGSHMTFKCPQLDEIKRGAVRLKSGICKKCLGDLNGSTEHGNECDIKRLFLDGAYILIKYSCDQHSIHTRVCQGQECKQAKPKRLLDPNQEKGPTKLRSFATKVITLANAHEKGTNDDPHVAFMAEISAIRGRDGKTLPCTLYYDSMGSRSWIQHKNGPLPPNFDWSPNPVTQRFSVQTITGEEIMDKRVHKIRLVTIRGPVTFQAVSGGLEGGLAGEDVDKEVALKYKLDAPRSEEMEKTEVVLIIGCDQSSLMPQSKKTPKGLKEDYPGISLADSKVTNRTLHYGNIQRCHKSPVRGHQA